MGSGTATMSGERDHASPEAAAVRQETAFISVVIPARDEEQTIGSVIDALLQQEYPADRFEIIVCEGYSDDNTFALVQEIAKRDDRVRLLRNEARLSSAGRNLGYRNSRGDIILFIDGHCIIPDKHLLLSVAELFKTTGAGCLCRAPRRDGRHVWLPGAPRW